MNAFAAIVFASLLSRLGYQMARSPVLPAFAANLGALPEFIGVIVAASTVTGVFFKLPSGALSDVLGRKRMMVVGALFFAVPPFLYPLVQEPWSLLALRFVHGFATAIDPAEFEVSPVDQPDPFGFVFDDGNLAILHLIAEGQGTAAVLLVCDPGRQAHQLFVLKRIKGRFGRQEYCFICPHTGRQSTVILSTGRSGMF